MLPESHRSEGQTWTSAHSPAPGACAGVHVQVRVQVQAHVCTYVIMGMHNGGCSRQRRGGSSHCCLWTDREASTWLKRRHRGLEPTWRTGRGQAGRALKVPLSVSAFLLRSWRSRGEVCSELRIYFTKSLAGHG